MRRSGYIKKRIFVVTITICQSMQDCGTHFLNNIHQRLYQSTNPVGSEEFASTTDNRRWTPN